MKLILCSLLISFGVNYIYANQIPDEIKELVKGVRETCQKETGVDIEHVDRTVEGYFHPSPVLGCYFSCVFTIFDLVDDAGHIDFQKLSVKVPDSFKDHGTEMIEKCKHITGENPCDSAFNIVQCFQKTNPSKFFVI